jgi:quercetin dioxygenase-like cupin family protein
MIEKASIDGAGEKAVSRFFYSPQVLRLRLDEGDERAEHSHPGKEIVLFVHQGEISLSLDSDRHTVTEGELLRFSGERKISPRAIEDSVALLFFVEKT